MRTFGWFVVFAVTMVLLCIPAEAEAAGVLTLTNIGLPSNTIKVQTITVGDGTGG